MCRRLPFGAVPGIYPVVYNGSDPEVLAVALSQRLLSDTPVIDQPEMRRFNTHASGLLRRFIGQVDPVDFDVWLESLDKPLEVKAQYRVVHNAMLDLGGMPLLSELRKYTPFVKSQSFEVSGGFTKPPRAILSPSAQLKVFAGPIIKAIEDEVYKLPFFVKHLTKEEKMERVQQLRSAYRFIYETDFSSMEASFVVAVQNSTDNLLFRHCLKDHPHLAECLVQVNSGRKSLASRRGLKIRVKGKRFSGDPWTSLGNGFATWALVSYNVKRCGGKWDGIFEGDDGLFGSTVPLSPEVCLRLGFTIKFDRVEDPAEASFCGLVFADSGQVIRDPIRFLQSFGYTYSYIHSSEAVMAQLLRAKALSAIYETPQCPIVGAFARRALQVTRGVRPRFVNDGYHVLPPDEMSIPDFCPLDDTRALFAKRYGISPAVQLFVEAQVMRGEVNDVANFLLSDGGMESLMVAQIVTH
jgi:hypothetical protein